MYQIFITLGFIATRIYGKYFHLDNRQHSEKMWIVFVLPGLVVFGLCRNWRVLLGILIFFEGFMLLNIISYYTVCFVLSTFISCYT